MNHSERAHAHAACQAELARQRAKTKIEDERQRAERAKGPFLRAFEDISASEARQMEARRMATPIALPVVRLCLDSRIERDSIDPMVTMLRRHPNARKVIVDIDGSGGDVREAWRLAGALRAHAGEVETRVSRRACSAALIVFAAGKTRIAAPGATFVFHGQAGKAGAQMNAAATKIFALMTGGNEQAYMRARTVGALTAVGRHTMHEHEISAREAMRMGLVTEVRNF
jgi:ATP-dependent protease ClpP protease subunit